jgi:DNA-binding transcriptional MerR regulator/methylmalonyl-CoA mutase cobalamin-binding subunit
MSRQFRHPIRVVALRTGLSPHVIRAWERRYGAITPQRTDTNRRLYSDEEIQRLQLLRRATRAGHSIGQIARLSDGDLQALVAEDQAYLPKQRDEARVPAREQETPRGTLDASIDAVMALDPAGLDRVLSRALVRLSPTVVLGEVLLPLMDYIGEKWQQGLMKIVHEHLASEVVRSTLGGLMSTSTVSGPAMVVATPAGQLHEFGALSVAVTAGAMGWTPVYLGPNLPAEEIAAAVEAHNASAVALSIVHPGDDPHVAQEIGKLRRLIGDDVVLLVGGRASPSYRDALDGSGAVMVGDLDTLRGYLESKDRSRTTNPR